MNGKLKESFSFQSVSHCFFSLGTFFSQHVAKKCQDLTETEFGRLYCDDRIWLYITIQSTKFCHRNIIE